MQISASAAASQLSFLSSSSSTARHTHTARAEVSQKVEPTAVAEHASTPAPTPAPTPSAGEDLLAGVLERLRFSAQEDGDHDHHHGHDSDRKQVRRELKQIERAVRHELKDLGKSLAADLRAAAPEDSRSPAEGGDVRHELKHLGQAFKHELKHAFEDAGEGHHFNPEGLVDAVRTAFDNLLSGLQSILGSPGLPVVDDPPADTQPGDTQPGDAALSEPATLAAPPAPPAPPAGEVVQDGVPAQVSTEPAAELSFGPPTAADLSAPLQELLRSFSERFPSMLSQLEDLLAPLSELPVEGDAAPTGDSSLSSTTRFEFAISTYTQVSFSLSIQEGAGLLDSVA